MPPDAGTAVVGPPCTRRPESWRYQVRVGYPPLEDGREPERYLDGHRRLRSRQEAIVTSSGHGRSSSATRLSIPCSMLNCGERMATEPSGLAHRMAQLLDLDP